MLQNSAISRILHDRFWRLPVAWSVKAKTDPSAATKSQADYAELLVDSLIAGGKTG
jgi:hypothetical protein